MKDTTDLKQFTDIRNDHFKKKNVNVRDRNESLLTLFPNTFHLEMNKVSIAKDPPPLPHPEGFAFPYETNGVARYWKLLQNWLHKSVCCRDTLASLCIMQHLYTNNTLKAGLMKQEYQWYALMFGAITDFSTRHRNRMLLAI